MRKKMLLTLTICMIAAVASAQKFHVVGVERTRLTVDEAYDTCKDNPTADFLVPYMNVIDSIMSPIVGRLECAAEIDRPESRMSNLMADIMLWSGSLCGEKIDVGVYNYGGVRSPMVAGDVTYGDVLAGAPFENKICFLSLTGDALTELFSQMAFTGGECVSKGVNLVFTKDGKLKSAKLNGKDIKPKKKYRIATNDFLAQGNDKMLAFKKKTDFVIYDDKDYNAREVIVKYFKYMKERGIKVNPQVEGRVVVE